MKILKILTLGFALIASHVRADDDLQQRLAAAKPGQTVELPAGEFHGGATLPPGVSLKGAGVGKTIIDATGSPNGISVEGGSGVQISDLTVRNAQGSAVVVRDAESVTVARVRATGAATGFVLQKVNSGRIENCISDQNRFGIAISGGSNCTIVNCTVTTCSDMGISLSSCPKLTVFNNCIVGSAIAINIDDPADMRVDHNIYSGLMVGQMQGQVGRRMLTAWQYLTGLDTHSVQMPVEFGHAQSGDFLPTTILPWALDRAATTDWGVAELSGIKAPDTDIAGRPRAGRFDVGAVEANIKAPRTPDGQFSVTDDGGIKSVGVFTRDGRLVTYMFHNLPLPAGKYSFWLPVRDYVGQPIPAGDYEVRLAQSDFHWKYLSHVGNNGEDPYGPGTSPHNPKLVAFAPNNTLVMLEGLSEDGMGVRAYDAATGKIRWHVPGTMVPRGVATGKDGVVYILRGKNFESGESRLTRIDSKTGNVIPYAGSNVGHVFPVTSGGVFSMAALGDRLYAADAKDNKLFVLTMSDGKVEKTLNVTTPNFVASDEKTNLLWVISGNTVVALNANGEMIAKSDAVPEPAAVAASEGKIAVASRKTGKIHFFDATEPGKLAPLREVGTGDGPFGKFSPDRFLFQQADGWRDAQDTSAGIAIDPAGQLAVADFRRTSMFDAAGKSLWHTSVVMGGPKPSYSTQNRRIWEEPFSFSLDYKTGNWEVEAFWDFSRAKSELNPGYPMLGEFGEGGKAFFVMAQTALKGTQMVVARVDDFKLTPVLKVAVENGQVNSREDSNGDGKITTADAATPLVDDAGKPLPPGVFQRFTNLESDGSISTVNGKPFLWKRTPGLSAHGAPIYEGRNYVPLPAKDWEKDISPYDLKPNGVAGLQRATQISDGGYVGQSSMRSSGGTGLNNAAGTDLCGYAADGRLRWVRQLGAHKGLGATDTVDDITLSAIFYSMETIIVDTDGLGLGGFCEPAQLHFPGYWISPANMAYFKGADGHIHMMIGDHASGRIPWFRLDNQESLKRTNERFTVAPDRASELVAQNWQPSPLAPSQSQPKIKVARLASPLPIDGDLEKWRKANIQPQIVLGPSGKLEGPRDLSALIRVAYEKNNLYVQVLSFDDVPVFGNFPVWQNSVEMAINGVFPDGMQFVAGKQADGKDVVSRNRFFVPEVKQIFFPADHAPCVVKVLDNAKDVTERETIERLYGEDLSAAKVIITEFKIPLDSVTYQGAEKDIPTLGPGKTFWINFFVDDSDIPYADVQELIGWPAGSGMFSTKEEAAVAVCE